MCTAKTLGSQNPTLCAQFQAPYLRSQRRRLIRRRLEHRLGTRGSEHGAQNMGTRSRSALWYRRLDEGILAAGQVFLVKIGKARVTWLYDLSFFQSRFILRLLRQKDMRRRTGE